MSDVVFVWCLIGFSLASEVLRGVSACPAQNGGLEPSLIDFWFLAMGREGFDIEIGPRSDI